MDTNSFIGIAALLFSLSNPIGVIPIFLSLTRDLTTGQKTMVIVAAASAVAGLLILSVLTGRQLLGFFNVGLDDFRIAGGLLALFVAFEMFQAKYGGFMQTREETSRTETDIHGIAITPLAFPLLVGPAEMSIMITLSSDAPTWMHKGGLIAAAVLTALLIAVSLALALPITKLIGKAGINVATRVMALFVAAIGVHFIVTGIRTALPGLA